jgi:alkaline phosphatase D
MKRRDFLKTSGYFVAAASIAGCDRYNVADKPDGGGPGGPLPPGSFHFPQGVASGDPRTTSVVLWTRVEPTGGGLFGLTVTVQVSDTEDFSSLVLDDQFGVGLASDHTVRVVVTGLEPATTYYYRFIAGQDTSMTGRTLTAPESDDVTPVRLAWVSCQDYGAGLYGAYRQLMNDDDARPEAERIQFVVHLGDFIYETVADSFQTALDDNFQPIQITDGNGNPRGVGSLPSGNDHATTVADYRALYKAFLSDPDLQAARARWPFICTWDDHEFTNDAWQTQANYDDESTLGEPAQTRKVAANQAWFEYIPANLSGAEGLPEVPSEAADFQPVEVANTDYGATDIDENYQITEANSQKAIGSMTIYRSFRYGQNVMLVMTDERSYRSDHAVPEEISFGNPAFFDPRNAIPKDLVDVLDQGMTANGGDPPDMVGFFPNPRKASPPGTMLGPDQKAWWKAVMSNTDATWKLWGNEVPLLRVLVKNEPGGPLILDRVMNADAWDGYNTERKELMQHLRDNNIQNLVVLTGDIHAQFASVIMDDFDAATPQAVATEFCTAGVASNSLFSFYESATRTLGPAIRGLITFSDDTSEFVNNLNVLFQHGMASAMAAAQGEDILDAKDPTVNPHLKFTDTNAQGYGLLTITSTEVTATLVTINRPITFTGDDGPGTKYTATFTVPKDDPAGLTDPTFAGAQPFPYSS